MNNQAYKEAAKKHNWEIMRCYRYEDWTIGICRNGKVFRFSNDVFVKPYPIVMEGRLPNADKIEKGCVAW